MLDHFDLSIVLQCVRPHLSAKAGLFVATKRHLRTYETEAIDPYSSGEIVSGYISVVKVRES